MARRKRTHRFADKDGYTNLVRNGRLSKEHRVIWERYRGKIPEGWHVHHRNGVKTDNRIGNLQLVTPAEHAALHRDQFRDRYRRLAATQNRDAKGRFLSGRKVAATNPVLPDRETESP